MTLSLSTLKPARGSRHSRKRVGRGNASGHGTTATRGTKGQRARQGGRKGLTQLGVKHFISRLPKVRGFTSFRARPEVVNVASLQQFADGTCVTVKLMAAKRLVAHPAARVKLIGSAPLRGKLTVEVHGASAGARAAIEAAGGEVKIIENAKIKNQNAK